MEKRLKIALTLISFGLFISIIFHLGVMFDLIGLKPKYLLCINAGLFLFMLPGASLRKKYGQDIVVENCIKSAMKIFPFWLKTGIVILAGYGVVVFINFMCLRSPAVNQTDISSALVNMNKGASAATMLFYMAEFSLLNLYWRVKRVLDDSERNR